MKIAVLGDIHANWVALRATVEHVARWKPDLVMVVGDIINRGPRPAECLQFIQEKAKTEGWLVIRGNHENYVIHQAGSKALPGTPAYEVHRPSQWTLQQLGRDVAPLLALSEQVSLSGPDGREVRMVHASMRGNRDGIYPETSDAELANKIAPPPALLLVGHTHRPHIRRLGECLVVNAGSLGLPFDRDTRTGYAQIEWKEDRWQAKMVRFPYDLARAEQDFDDFGYRAGGGPLVDLVRIELRTARSLLFDWAAAYQHRALAGEISMEESVEQFLKRSSYRL